MTTKESTRVSNIELMAKAIEILAGQVKSGALDIESFSRVDSAGLTTFTITVWTGAKELFATDIEGNRL